VETVLLLYLLGLAFIVVFAYFTFGSFLSGAGYQPTPPGIAQKMLDLGEVGPDDLVVDLGAGTGALLFRAVHRRGARGIGVEIEPIRYLFLRLRRSLSPAKERLEIRRTNLFEMPLQEATVVLAFLWPPAMAKLKGKLARELRPGARVVSYYHPIPGWTPSAQDARRRVFLYRAPFAESASGAVPSP
jgi:SAM-dependent methyltransferase